VKIIRNKKIGFLWGAAFLSMLCIIFAGYKFESGFHAADGPSSGDSYDKTAWKFADLVQGGVLYPVVRDIDGDTIVVDVAGHDITVRLIGADTPETVDPRKSVQCYGPEASAEAKRIFGVNENHASTTGISVYLDKDPVKGDYDKYGRLLAYIRLPADIVPADGIGSTTDLYNEYVIVHGFAHEYTFLNQPYKYQAEFKADEAAAKQARVGLWGKCPDANDGD
jgi:micrococcal nuclease